MVCDRRTGVLAGLISAALALAGCKQGADLAVTQDAGGVGFALAVPAGDAQRCIESVTVYPRAPDDAEPVWEISRDRSAKGCTTTVRYGELPPEFGARVPAAPLQAQAGYRVVVSGLGFSAAAVFERTPS